MLVRNFFGTIQRCLQWSLALTIISYLKDGPIKTYAFCCVPRLLLLNTVSSRFDHQEGRTCFNPQQLKYFARKTSCYETNETATSFLEFEDPKTKCQIVLLGCMHGSSSSAADVAHVLLDTPPSPLRVTESNKKQSKTYVVVLELCASRFADLRREMEKDKKLDQCDLLDKKEQLPSGVTRFSKVIAKTIRKRGLATGVATAILGGANGLQTALSGFEPGLEFKTAVEIAEKIEGCDIILADRTVDETLQRFGSLPSVSADMIREWVIDHKLSGWDKAFGREAIALQTAIDGDAVLLPNQLSMRDFLTRHEGVKNDLLRLTLPPLILAQVFVSFILSLWNAFEGDGFKVPPFKALFMDPSIQLSLSNAGAIGTDLVADIMTSAVVVALGYIALALPATRLILCERDDQLVEGIHSACEIASSKYNNNIDDDNGGPGRVVAILGFLHVNGVAKRLLTAEET